MKQILSSNIVKRIFHYLVSIAVLFGLWWLASTILPLWFDNPLAKFILPPPDQVLLKFVDELPKLWNHFIASGLRIILSLTLAMAIAVPAGLIIGFEPTLNRMLSPLIYLTYPVPKVVFMPILFVLFGIEDGSRIALLTLVLSFQILLSARDAAQSIGHQHVLSAKSVGADRWQLYWHVVFPASLPAILTAARISIGLAFATLFLAESFVKPNFGLGAYIVERYSVNGYLWVTVGILAMGMLGFLFYIVLDWIEHWLCRWRFRGENN